MKRSLTITLCFLLSSTAWAQSTMAVENYRPNMNSKGMFSAESSQTLKQLEFGLNLQWNYAASPFRVPRGDFQNQAFVLHRMTLDVMTTFGITDWLEIGAGLPMVMMNDLDSRTGFQSVLGPGMGRLQLKVRFLSEKQHGIGMAFLAHIGAPLVTENGFLAENGGTLSPTLIIEKRLGVARLLANIGYTARKPGTFRDIVIDDELFWKFGLGFQISKNVEFATELSGATAAGDLFGGLETRNPLELLFGARIQLARGVLFQAGFGPGLSKGTGTPVFRAFGGIAFIPQFADADKDGVADDDDRCPKTPGPAANQGCPWPDTDKDGVLDKDDKCPKVAGPKENAGCPWPDTDKDGVLDKDDKCPKVAGPKENKGCPWPDSDKDGVVDKDDKCPRVPGPKENAGCPWPDTDKDGVLDKDDKCPKVAGPKENAGCPWPDTDKDGVLDKDDKCPKVPGPKDNAGCPKIADKDGDGVPDKSDRCPDVAGPKLNGGCPWPDTDKDGVLDKDDECPQQAGPASNKGCPVKGVKVTRTEAKIPQQIRFRTGSASIRRASYGVLNQVASLLRRLKHIRKVEIQGHTDDVGSAAMNRGLSKRRANSVRRYLMRKKVSGKRLTAVGYGEDKPLKPIDTKAMSRKEIAAARAANRRVQFMIREQ